MENNKTVQNKILEDLQRMRSPIDLITINGFHLRGVILDQDDSVIILNSDGHNKMIYKHAISTISSIKLSKSQ